MKSNQQGWVTCLALLLLNQSGSHTHTHACTHARMHIQTHSHTHTHTRTHCSILTFCMDSSEYILSSLVSRVDIVDCSSVNSEKLSRFTFVPYRQNLLGKSFRHFLHCCVLWLLLFLLLVMYIATLTAPLLPACN